VAQPSRFIGLSLGLMCCGAAAAGPQTLTASEAIDRLRRDNSQGSVWRQIILSTSVEDVVPALVTAMREDAAFAPGTEARRRGLEVLTHAHRPNDLWSIWHPEQASFLSALLIDKDPTEVRMVLEAGRSIAPELRPQFTQHFPSLLEHDDWYIVSRTCLAIAGMENEGAGNETVLRKLAVDPATVNPQMWARAQAEDTPPPAHQPTIFDQPGVMQVRVWAALALWRSTPTAENELALAERAEPHTRAVLALGLALSLEGQVLDPSGGPFARMQPGNQARAIRVLRTAIEEPDGIGLSQRGAILLALQVAQQRAADPLVREEVLGMLEDHRKQAIAPTVAADIDRAIAALKQQR